VSTSIFISDCVLARLENSGLKPKPIVTEPNHATMDLVSQNLSISKTQQSPDDMVFSLQLECSENLDPERSQPWQLLLIVETALISFLALSGLFVYVERRLRRGD
jgi:hypothetical protein